MNETPGDDGRASGVPLWTSQSATRPPASVPATAPTPMRTKEETLLPG